MLWVTRAVRGASLYVHVLVHQPIHNCLNATSKISKVLSIFIYHAAAAAAAAKSLQSCPTLWDPTDGSTPGSALPGILQTRTLEWVAISFSNTWKWKVKVKSLSCVRPSVTPWTAAFQAPLPMGFSRQEYWSGVPLPSPIKDNQKEGKENQALSKALFCIYFQTLLLCVIFIYIIYIYTHIYIFLGIIYL